MVDFKNNLIQVLVTFMVCLSINNCALAVINGNLTQNISQRYFIPVTEKWQIEMCAKFEVNIKAVNHFESTYKRLTKPILGFGLTDVKGDGNCFFRAISVWITGSEDYHLLFRFKLVEFMKICPIIIQYFGERNIIDYIEEENMDFEGTWATDIEIRATAIMLDTTILIYADQQTDNWEIHHKSGDLRSNMDENEECIYLKCINAKHYQVVTAVEEYWYEPYDVTKCKRELDFVFGLNTKALVCVKITIHNIMFSTDYLDDAVKMYIFTFRSSSINCDHILLPIDFCRKEVYGQENFEYIIRELFEYSPLHELYEACVIELSVFGDDKNKIFENALSFHKSGEESLAWPGNNSSQNTYFIHEFNSYGDAYLDHIAEVIVINDSVMDPISFCEQSLNEESDDSNTKFIYIQ